MGTKKRWEKEGEDFLNALTGGDLDNPLKKKKPSADETEAEQRLRIRQTTAGGRPSLHSPVTDPLVPYNFKIKASELDAIRNLAKDKTKTIRELMSEAIHDLITKYAGNNPDNK